MNNIISINNPFSFLLKNRRFDLFIKYLCLEKREKNPVFFDRLYVEHIKAFNNFNEDCGRKRSEKDFVDSFWKIVNNIDKNGFDENISRVPINAKNQVVDGAHRVAACAYLNKPFVAEEEDKIINCDYDYFLKKNFPVQLADYVALEYVKHNPNSYIVNLHAINDIKYDEQVENILSKYGFVYYKKNVFLNYNAYVSLKKINYGSEFWNQETFIGSYSNDFQGAKDHATRSFGKNPLRVYVFVCDNLEKVLEAKKEIRDIFKIGNHSIHINDTHEEGIRLAELYFNDNSIHLLNNSPYNLNLDNINVEIDNFKSKLELHGINHDDVCVVGSVPLALYNIRKTNDIDFVSTLKEINEQDFNPVDLHKDYHYFSNEIFDIIYNSEYYFYYRGLKIITLNVLYNYKKNRYNDTNDIKDIKDIKAFYDSDSWIKDMHKRKMITELKMFRQYPIKYCFYKIKSALARIKWLRQLWIRLKELKK
jgi:hypothetical protein